MWKSGEQGITEGEDGEAGGEFGVSQNGNERGIPPMFFEECASGVD